MAISSRNRQVILLLYLALSEEGMGYNWNTLLNFGVQNYYSSRITEEESEELYE